MSPRTIGAIAALAPAVVIFGWYVGTGGPSTPGLLGIAAAAVAAGWIVGPLAHGSASTYLVAMAGYFVVAYLFHSVTDGLVVVLESVQAGQLTDPSSVLQRIAGVWLGRLVYLPVWAILLSPATLAWVIAVRLLRNSPWSRAEGRRAGPDHGGDL